MTQRLARALALGGMAERVRTLLRSKMASVACREAGFRWLRRLSGYGTVSLVALGPVLAVLTVAMLASPDANPTLPALRLILLVDLIYVLAVATLIMARVARLIAARRLRSAGSQLHLRLATLFAVIALVPTITVAAFSVVIVNIGLEGWFSQRVRQAIAASLAAAEAYQAEQARHLLEDAESLQSLLNLQITERPFVSDGELRQLLAQGQASIQRGLRVAFILDRQGQMILRGERSYLFDFVQPSEEARARAEAGETVLIRDLAASEFRVLAPLAGPDKRFLYVARTVDADLLGLLDDTAATIRLYQELESERGRLLANFALLYLGFALILILAAIWLGMWFAEKLSGPIGRLAAAAQAVGQGNLAVRVPEEPGDDEIATLGRVFNRMTEQLAGQRERLLANARQIEARRRLFDSVLSSVTAGVIGLDPEGRVSFINRAAVALTAAADAEGRPLTEVVPEFAPLFERLKAGEGALDGRVQGEVRLVRHGRHEILLARLAERRGENGVLEGYVLAFDDVTDLVSAQRMAAWGDVARRIAHEIKNPLTPIQLSADRIRRKFRRHLPPEEVESLNALTETIIRQTNDLRRIVDEFSRFARMPEPNRRPEDLVALIKAAVTLQEAGQADVTFILNLPDEPVLLELDATMIGQMLTNLLKNAGEAIAARRAAIQRGQGDDHSESALPEWRPEIRVSLTCEDARVTLTIDDNGIGLPSDRARLFEPYVTTRAGGTGLGLPIVKKIVEEHGGALILTDAPAFGPDGHRGARAEIRFPRAYRGLPPNSAHARSEDITA